MGLSHQLGPKQSNTSKNGLPQMQILERLRQRFLWDCYLVLLSFIKSYPIRENRVQRNIDFRVK